MDFWTLCFPIVTSNQFTKSKYFLRAIKWGFWRFSHYRLLIHITSFTVICSCKWWKYFISPFPFIYLIFIIFSVLSPICNSTPPSSPVTLLSSSLLPWLRKTPWWILASHSDFKGMKMLHWSVPSVFSVPPFICLDILRQEMRSSATAPTWISLSPPVGTCAGHFRSYLRRERMWERERLSMRRNSDREKTLKGRKREKACGTFLTTQHYMLSNPCFTRTLYAIIRYLWSTDNSNKGGVGGIIRYSNSKTEDLLQTCLVDEKHNCWLAYAHRPWLHLWITQKSQGGG